MKKLIVICYTLFLLNYFFIVSRYISNVHLLINQLTMKKIKKMRYKYSYSGFKEQLVEIAVLILYICIVGFLWSFGWVVNSLANLIEAYQSFVTIAKLQIDFSMTLALPLCAGISKTKESCRYSILMYVFL